MALPRLVRGAIVNIHTLKKVRFHPSAKLKIDMLNTSIGSCIRRGRWNISRHLRAKLRCGVFILVLFFKESLTVHFPFSSPFVSFRRFQW